MLGDLIAHFERPDVCASVLATLDPEITERIAERAAAASMTTADFAASKIREFIERSEDDLWFQLMTIMRKSTDPGTLALQTILRWSIVGQQVGLHERGTPEWL